MAIDIACQNVSKRFGSTSVLDGLTWFISAGRIAGLLGESGAGKTTLLRLIAGLDEVTVGEIRFDRDGQPVSRDLARPSLLFQSLALWPHLTVRRHVELILPRQGRAAAADALLDECRLPRALWDRRPGQLSGGEAQRVALARALANRPGVLLLDEPLANVDATLRSDLTALIRDLVAVRQVTVVYVSHVWDEVSGISDTVAVLDAGRLVQQGAVDEVYWSPANSNVAKLTGPVLQIPRPWIDAGYLADARPLRDNDEGDIFFIRPQQLAVVEPNGQNCWRVAESGPCGNGWQVTLRTAGAVLRGPLPYPLAVHDQVGLVVVEGGSRDLHKPVTSVRKGK